MQHVTDKTLEMVRDTLAYLSQEALQDVLFKDPKVRLPFALSTSSRRFERADIVDYALVPFTPPNLLLLHPDCVA